MGMKRRFSSDWEPVVLETSVLAEGTWTYQGKVEYSVRLVRRTWDYTSADIDATEKAVSESINGDYIDYAISDEGNVFFWEFRDKGGCTTSPHFASVEAANTHFSTYAGPSKIHWYI